MRNAGFQLDAAAGSARPPFAYDQTVTRRRAFWSVRAADGRKIGEAPTRAGARAAVHALYGGGGPA